jgi:hypothetical protein
MADNVYKWILDATAGAPLPFVLILLVASFILVKAATVSLFASPPAV